MKKTINEMVQALIANKSQIMKIQKEYEATLSEKERLRKSRNGNTNGGWCVPGNCAFTKAVHKAGMPSNHFWSGSAPTPSTQYPRAIYDFLTQLNA